MNPAISLSGMRRFLSAALCLFAATLPPVLARAQPAAIPSLAVPDGLGFNIHFTDPQPGEMEKLAASGIRWVRMDLLWRDTEREKNKYDFSAYDRLVQALEQHGLKALFILDYGNPLYDGGLAPHSEEGRSAFARWAAAAAKRYAGKGFLWEVWNEPNGKNSWYPKPDAEAYCSLALAVGKEFRQQGLSEALIGPATSRVDLGFIKTCLRMGLLDSWAAVSVHPYRQWLPPETAGVSYARLRKLLARYASGREPPPILSGEWGYSSVQLGFDDTLQAKFLARMWLFNLSEGIPVSIWYDWSDDGDGPNNREHHFGTVHRDFQPKTAYFAAKTLTEQLRGFGAPTRLGIGGCREYVVEFSQAGERRWAAWTTSPKPGRVLIPGLKGRFRSTDFDGKTARILTASPQGLEVTLRDGPQYLVPMAD